jgi:hypothetical protein
MTQGVLRFDGPDLQPADEVRLSGQLARVRTVMSGGAWLTLAEIAERAAGSSEAGVSARLRDLRKPRFGGHTVERRRRTQGLWEYRVLFRRQP